MFRTMDLEMGYSQETYYYLRYMDEESKENYKQYYLDALTKGYKTYDNIDEVNMMVSGAKDAPLTYEEQQLLEEYTGYDFKFINDAMRNEWTYERDGNVKDKPRYETAGKKLTELLMKKGMGIGNTRVFRGVSLDYFKGYGIHTLEELDSLKGKPLVDFGFVSTSILESTCYYKKELETGLNYNVKIEYLVPEDFDNGLYLGNVSYCPNQNEYLISSANMAQVYDVIHEPDGAIIKAVLVPKEVYDKGYKKHKEEQRAMTK